MCETVLHCTGLRTGLIVPRAPARICFVLIISQSSKFKYFSGKAVLLRQTLAWSAPAWLLQSEELTCWQTVLLTERRFSVFHDLIWRFLQILSAEKNAQWTLWNCTYKRTNEEFQLFNTTLHTQIQGTSTCTDCQTHC